MSNELAIRLAAMDPATEVGFMQSPMQVGFVRRTGDRLLLHDGTEVDLSWVFDLRMFSASAEMHWWWDQRSAEGRHHILDDSTAAGRGWFPLPAGSPRRLLRGTAGDIKPGWSRLHDGHSQPLWIPFIVKPGSQVALCAVEYACTDDHGNIGVVAERLTTFEEL